MNLFIGIGVITDVYLNGRALKFTLAIQQEKPCNIPCLIFDPTDEVKEFVDNLQSTKQEVWLQGRVASYEFESRGKPIRKLEVITWPRNIRAI
jgi:hypothetical protein